MSEQSIYSDNLEEQVEETIVSDEERGDSGVEEPEKQYSLPGDPPFFQVEFESSYWARCPVLRTVSRADVYRKLNPGGKTKVKPYPLSDSPQAQRELQEIEERFHKAHDLFPQEELSLFLQDKRFVMPPPAGAVLNRRPNQLPIIYSGAELASLFEGETPGLWHRHVLNVLLDSPINPDDPNSPKLREALSPTRQALIWQALDTAISSALLAIWHYKWIARGLKRVAFRERPWEANHDLPILFDRKVEYQDGTIVRRTLKPKPQPTPGTPRHPAYGSGHSTYSSAASYVLGCLLPDRYKRDFQLLADNIGEARIWGGVHWRTDHEFGQLVGTAVGELIIEQLTKTNIKPCPGMTIMPPTREEILKQALDFERRCGKGSGDFCTDCPDLDKNIQNLQG